MKRKIQKRDGSIVQFDRDKIYQAIIKAVRSIGGADKKEAERLTGIVCEKLDSRFRKGEVPTVEEVQDIVETVLIKEGHAKTAKAFILYRQKRSDLREKKKEILGGLEDRSSLSINQLRIAAAKYLERDYEGKISETPLQMFRRIARTMASVEKKSVAKTMEEEFYKIMRSLDFLPGGRTLANAGTHLNQLANCFVIPVNDSLEDIFESVKEQAIIQKLGGGTGFDFSRLRQRGSDVKGSKGRSSGPVEFLKVFDATTRVIRQGNRKGANMGILRVDHPDIVDFIQIKDDESVLKQFNISVAITDEFMRAFQKNVPFELVDPHTQEPVKTVDAKELFNLIVTHAWHSGEPGVLFIDHINRKNPTRKLGAIEATDPCGLVPLHPYEACNIGSLNLDNFVSKGKVDWQRLGKVTKLAARFLDNAIDAGNYPLRKIEKVVRSNRRIGLGVMGWADMLYQLRIPYDSEKAVRLAGRVMGFIKRKAREMSKELAKEKGVFPNWRESAYSKKKLRMRNATLLAIAPNGSLSMLAETSGGIEPNFAICFLKYVLEGEQFLYVNRHFRKISQDRGFFSPELMKTIAETQSIRGMDVPDEVKKVFVTSHDIAPEWHIRMQAAFQKHVDNAISKTINFPRHATVKDFEKGFVLAYDMRCKGLTAYRDTSRRDQVLTVKKEDDCKVC